MISAASAAAIDAAADIASAYVHIPFCARVCPYCDFTVVAGKDELTDRYLDALRIDIASTPAWRPLDAVFVGGGTPSRIGPERLTLVLEWIRTHHGLAPGAEVTLEANPEDLTPGVGEQLVEAGFNRISLGVQSFDDRVLEDLGRVHDRDGAVRAVELAKRSGFASVSVDLIFGSPAETDESWRETLTTAVAVSPHHMSTYALTVEPGTVLWKQTRRGAAEPDADVQADRWEMAAEMLASAGFERYEVSNHALPGHHCRYNAAVWAHAEYLAFGVGAHAYRNGVRTANVRRLDTYIDRVERGLGPVQSADPVDGWASELERMFVGLRRTSGVELGEGGRALIASEEGRRLLEHGVIRVRDDRLIVARPLFTDEVLRTALGVVPSS